MPCTPFQYGASSLATSPRGSEMQCSSGHSPTPLAWPTGAKYYHQRWSLAGGGGVLRYVLVLNTQQKQEDNQAPILISARQRGGGGAGEGPKYDDEGARRQGQTRHTPEREVTSQPPSSSTLGYYSALQPGMCWCGHGRLLKVFEARITDTAQRIPSGVFTAPASLRGLSSRSSSSELRRRRRRCCA